jgi:hypothetical protein
MSTRAALVLALLTLPACTSLSGASKRVALTPNPGAPPQLRGSPGLGLATRIPMGAPSGGGKGDGIAIPIIQPEVNGVFRFAERAYGSFDLNFTIGGDTHVARPDLPRAQSELTFGALLGGGYDFPLSQRTGVNVSAEGGFNYVAVNTSIGGTFVGLSNYLLLAGRVAAAPYVELKIFRIFGGAVISTDVYNEANGFATTCGGCGVVDTGRTETAALLMIGGGARVQPSKDISFGAEVWVPLTQAGVRHPPQLLFALQVGNLDFSPSQREAEAPAPVEQELAPPPPPPQFVPAPVPL